MLPPRAPQSATCTHQARPRPWIRILRSHSLARHICLSASRVGGACRRGKHRHLDSAVLETRPQRIRHGWALRRAAAVASPPSRPILPVLSFFVRRQTAGIDFHDTSHGQSTLVTLSKGLLCPSWHSGVVVSWKLGNDRLGGRIPLINASLPPYPHQHHTPLPQIPSPR